jgi:diadenosine tetraphosphate (Ap4A) HIT family hydrolase
MIEPKRHVAGLGELTDGEAAALGVLVNNLGRALKDSEGAEHVYSFVLGDEVPHLHIHLVPRYSGAPREYWGVRASQWPDAPGVVSTRSPLSAAASAEHSLTLNLVPRQH